MDVLIAHRSLMLDLIVVLAIVLAFWGVYHAGTRHGAVTTRVATLDATRLDQMRKVAQAELARDSVARANDTLRAKNATLHARNDSLARQVAESRTAANLIRSKLTIQRDTATLTTDTGVVRIPIPAVLAQQLARERAAMDSAYRVLERHRDSVASENRGLLQENAGLRVEISLDSVVTSRLRALNDSSATEIRVLKAESHPRFSFTQGLVAGVIGTGAAVVGLLVAF